MTEDVAATLALILHQDEPTQLLAYLKQQTMTRMEAVEPIDAFLAKQWAEVAEGLAEIELKLQNIKRPA
jgi:hypothetical protein